jgi:hypothetical protein
MRVIFDQQQEYLSPGQTIAVYIPFETVLTRDQVKKRYHNYQTNNGSSSTPSLNPPADDLTNPVYSNQFPTVLQSDIQYETDLYKQVGNFDLPSEFSSQQTQNNDQPDNTPHHNSSKNHSLPLTEPHVLLDSALSRNVKNNLEPFGEFLETPRATTVPSALDRFICIGSGTIML